MGLLGVGLMGSAMAHRLLNEGIPVVAWDREPAHVQGLGPRGVEIASSPSDAVSGADVVITMLPTAEIVRSVVEPPAAAVARVDDLAADEQCRGGRVRPA